MPHIAGHIQNSFLRWGTAFKHHAGVLHPAYIIDDKLVPISYPIIFFHDGKTDDKAKKLKYGMPVAFLPQCIEVGNNKFVYATNVSHYGFHEEVEKVMKEVTLKVMKPRGVGAPDFEFLTSDQRKAIYNSAPAPQKPAIKEEMDYIDSPSYRALYPGKNQINEDKKVAVTGIKAKVPANQNNLAIHKIIDLAVPFDDMNLATN